MKKTILITLSLLIFHFSFSAAQSKRDFRGAWIQAVNGQFQGIGRDSMQRVLTYQLDELQKDGCNAIIFQVRPECDALYQSSIEPWSKFLTGVQGRAPQPYWDPLEWMVQECHKRGMELHAWINPFRAKTKATSQLAENSWVRQHPENWFVYDDLYILNPAIDENTRYTCRVVKDILTRYDVDGLHIDDYFYPYPSADRAPLPDEQYFRDNPHGFTDIADWRRDNVSRFVQALSDTIRATKPWVKFGVSPFGVYRNKKNDPLNGSDTNAFENYSGLYADVLLWINNGWVDYCVPQLYWQIGHKTADYETLIRWWNKLCGNRPLFIGEDVERTVKYSDVNNKNINQMPAKFRLHTELPNVKGTVLWYAKTAVDNVGNYGTTLRNYYWRYPALQPEMTFIDATKPGKVRKLQTHWTPEGYQLQWQAPRTKKGWRDEAYKYVVYRFGAKEPVNLSDPSHIAAITYDSHYLLPYEDGTTKYVYVVTALTRLHNEGQPTKKKVKL